MEFFPFEEDGGTTNGTSDLLFKFDDDNYVLLVDGSHPVNGTAGNGDGGGRGVFGSGQSSSAAAAAAASAAAAAFGVSTNGSLSDGDWNGTFGFEDGLPFDDYYNRTYIILRGGEGVDGVGYYPSGYSLPHIILASIVVTMLMIVVVVGNMLVIIAIATEKALKNIQNWFIASLAVADFFLGLVIMPFSLANELMGYWIFGPWWCDIHSAADVLLCTASIMNLCLISLDRYWSITQAVDYLKRRTPLRAAIMIAVVWVMSGLICIPPLLGWKVQRPEKEQYPKCQLSEDIGYVLYSALGSFYIPSCIMVFVYIRIYFAAKARARRGIRKRPKPTAPTAQQQRNTMEMATIVQHRPPGDGPPGGKHVRLSTSLSNPGAGSNPPPVIISIPVVTCDYASDMSTSDQGPGVGDPGNGVYLEAPCSGSVLQQGSAKAARPDQQHPMASPFRDSTLSVNGDVQGRRGKGEENNGGAAAGISSTSSSSAKCTSSSAALCVPPVIETDMVSEFDPSSSDSGVVSRCAVVKPLKLRLCQPIFGRRSGAALSGASSKAKREVVDTGRRLSSQGPGDGEPGQRRKDSLKGLTPKSMMASTDAISTASADGAEEPAVARVGSNGGRSRGNQGHHHHHGPAPPAKPRDPEREKRRIARKKEKRATLILGLIMGSFIACWLPFFFLYILTPMCPICHIPASAFSTAFWLGYMNSALNPVIYTIFNKDFRRAFRRILFK